MSHQGRDRHAVRTVGVGLVVLALTGCAFYGNEHNECLELSSPEECFRAAEGPPDGETGGVGGWDTGGASSGGARPAGGSGGLGTGGDLGTGGGLGTGGDLGTGGSSGGTGGEPATGGQGTGATGGLAIARVNEIRITGSRYVEIFNAGSAALRANDTYVTSGSSGPEAADECQLGADLPAGGFALFASTGQSCLAAGHSCVECEFSLSAIAPASTVYIVSGDSSVLHQVKYPDIGSPGSPNSTSSWSASVDGGSTFGSSSPSPGLSNTP